MPITPATPVSTPPHRSANAGGDAAVWLRCVICQKKIEDQAMDKASLVLITASVLLFFLGYNFLFNTRKIITKMASMANYREGSFMYKMVTSNSNIIWVKIGGGAAIVMALLYFSGAMIILLDK